MVGLIMWYECYSKRTGRKLKQDAGQKENALILFMRREANWMQARTNRNNPISRRKKSRGLPGFTLPVCNTPQSMQTCALIKNPSQAHTQNVLMHHDIDTPNDILVGRALLVPIHVHIRAGNFHG